MPIFYFGKYFKCYEFIMNNVKKKFKSNEIKKIEVRYIIFSKFLLFSGIPHDFIDNL